ncbi:MAG: hypothetical protein IJH05_01620 [Firmicutes bacterium]|nr:hypothetical protein [Bacillota bacterium]
MLKNRKLLSIILAFIMALTITGQAPAFALENENSEQPAVEQSTEPTEAEQQEENTDENVGEEPVDLTDNSNAEEETVEEEQLEAQGLEDPELTAMGGVITASGLTRLPSKPTSTKWDGKTIDVSWYDPSEPTFTISTGAELAGLAALVNGSYDKTITQYYGNPTQLGYIQCVKLDNFMFVGAGGGNTGGTCYKSLGTHDFMGKMVKVTADLDMTSGNYMPIGGKYPMCDANGSMFVNNEAGKGDAHVMEAFFNGILDCGGHTIKIRCNRYTGSGFAYSMAAGLVGYMGSVIDADDVEKYKSQYTFTAQTLQSNWAPTVKNVSLEGSVYARRMVGGIVGQVGDSWDEKRGVFVENCANHANVSSTDAKGCGGVVGAGWGKGHIINCYNTGTIEATYSTCPVGGICAGNGGMDIYNCYNIGKMMGNGYGRGLGGHDSGSYTIDNSYTLKGCNTDSKNAVWYEGTAADITIKNTGALEKNDMANEGFTELLNAGEGDNNYAQGAFVWNEEKNSGYPILFFEEGISGSDCTVTINTVANGSITCFYNGRNLSSGDKVPYGAVISLSEVHDGGYILNHYKAGRSIANMDLIADFCTVTENLTISADIIQLKEGTLLIDDEESKDCTVSVTKKGLSNHNGEITTVKRQKVVTGDKLYQLDIVTAAAVLYENAYPTNANKEYSGEFNYSFKYMKNNVQVGETVTNQTGKFTVNKNIDGAQIVVTAEPVTQPKTWQSFADTSWYYDNEPGDDYVIDSAEDLAGLAYLVNVEQITFSGETIVIPSGAVISLKNTDGRGGTLLWPGIGVNSSTTFFAGTLQGNGCTILDMSRIDETGSNGGLFNFCCNATIKNLNVRGETQVQSIGGGIIGYGENCKVENCINYVDVTNQLDSNPDGDGTVGERTGGIIAQANGGSITSCINRGDIFGGSGTGGIAGQCHGSEVTITKCTNYGDIQSASYTDSFNLASTGTNGVGGIAGRTYGNISLCANYGEIRSTDKNTGGIAGYVVAKGTAKAFTITGCYNRGTIDAKSSNTYMAAGGLIGGCGSVALTNSYSTGAVTGSSTSSYICGGVGYFECKSGTSAKNNYVLNCNKAWGHNLDANPDYISIVKKDDAYMKSAVFVTALSNSELKAVSGSYPEFKRMSDNNSIEKTYTVTFSGSDLDGKSFKINKGGSIPYISAGAWSAYRFTVNGEEWTGRNITSDVTVSVTKESVPFKAIFKADGQVVAEVSYTEGTTYDSIKPSATKITDKDGYAGMWPADITLNDDEDTTINAVYYPSGSIINVQDGIEVTDGKYYIGGKSTGTITITAGSSVKLIGDSGLCENLRVVMKAGSTLEAKDLQISCDTDSVLTMAEGCKLTLTGNKNHIEGTDTDSKECVPAINVLGTSTINGDGTLKATAETGDTVIDIADGKTLTIASGTIKLYKNSKIGAFDGGVINSGRDTASGTGTLVITGGTVYCTSNSDNMHAIKVGTFNMSGGDVLVISNDEETALLAKNMSVTSGNLKVIAADYAKNETDKSAENRQYYYNEKAIGCTAFSGNYVCTRLDVNNMSRPYKVSVGNTTFNCQGLGLDYSIDGEKLVKTSDTNIYVWGSKSSSPSVVPADADMSLAENQRGYVVSRNGNAVNISMTRTKSYKKTWYKACATYDASGNMLQFKFKQIKDTGSLDMSTLSGSATSYELFVFQNVTTLVPAMSSYKVPK